MFSQLRIERNFLNLVKNIYKKATANTILNGKKTGAFPLRWDKARMSSALVTPTQIILEVLAKAVR